MHLSKLELLGFKSFPNKTELTFDSGLTAIVGPNGCGKTNLLDAVRWVLGEQRVTLLRGSRMEEVIFNGTKELKPLGMAEVSLVVKNDKGILPVDYGEVRITRRLYRSGESEYLLNGTSCRLKDITDLFLDTGMGAHAYSVIQPVMIEAVLSDKAEDRRVLFEEASGITKYKLRKKVALRKLEITENDILRLNDIATEVERQTSSLRKQVRRTERFKRLSEEATKLETKLAQADFEALREKAYQLEQSLIDSRKEMTEHTTDLSKQEAEVESLKLVLLETEREVITSQRRVASDTDKIHQVERDALVRKERKTSLEKSVLRLRQELDDLSNRRESFQKERIEKQRQLEETAQGLKGKERELDEEEKKLLISDEKRKETKKIFEEREKERSGKEEGITDAKGKKANLEGICKQLEQREKVLAEEKAALLNRIGELKLALSELVSIYRQKEEAIEKENTQRELWEEEKRENQDGLESLTERIIKLGNDLSSQAGRLTLYQEMMKEWQGFKDGVRYVLDRRSVLAGVIDSVAGLINSKEEYLPAIESALGEKSQFLICEDEPCALRAIESLRENKGGRAAFLILDKINKFADQIKKVDFGEHKGVVGWAPDLIDCQEKYRPVIKLLLGHVLVVNSFKNVLELASLLEDRLCLVSLDGQVVRPRGVLEGGWGTDISLLGRETHTGKMKEQILALEGESEKLEEERRKIQDRVAELDQLSREKSELIKEQSRELDQRRLEGKQMEFEKSNLDERIGRVTEESGRTREELNQLGEAIGEMESKIRLQQQENLEFEGCLEISRNELEQIEEERNGHLEEANRRRIDLVSLVGKEEQRKIDIARLGEILEDVGTNTRARTEQLTSSEHSIQEIMASDSGVDEEFKNLFEQKKINQGAYNSCQDRYNQLQTEISSREGKLKSVRRLREEFQSKVHDLELAKLEKATCARSLRDKVWEEYQVNLEDLSPLSAEEKSNLESYQQRIRNLKEEIARLGPVNLVALEEYGVVKERLDFLKGQMKDLVEAKTSLNTTIDKIDQTAREMFIQTFQQVRSNFQNVFGELFEGGEADLVLQQDTDVLESPIEISARPRGKRLVNINQLSGGEKALTAISLILAIYLVRPSPFCILDEIDAPLDDANVKRFLKLIRNFSSNTQFLTITHNKLTMETADTLYGVTMEEPGVSKIVSVKLDRQEVLAGEET